MRRWKRLLAAGLLSLAAALCSPAGSVMVKAEASDPALRRNNVNPEEWLQRVGDTSSGSEGVSKKAWKRINGICYNGSGNPVPDVITRGMDVSEWQGKINWKKVKGSDIDFAFVRISYGSGYIDKYYDYNMKQANEADIPVGTYVYSLATNTKMALKEAQLAIKRMDGYKVSYPVVFDLEYSKMGELSKKKVAKIALAFCNEIRSAGYTPMVYLNTNWYDNHVDMSMLSGIPVWIASYSDTKPAPDRTKYNYGIWQCTAGNSGTGSFMVTTKGLVDGVPRENNVDMNYGYVDYTKIVSPRWGALESYVPAETASVQEPSKKDGWYEENNKKYYYVGERMVTGWKKIDGKYYCFHPTKGYLYKNKLLNQNGKVYYVDKTGARVTNKWVKKGGRKYYMGKNGLAVKGGKKIDGIYYYFDLETRAMYENQKLSRKNKICYYGKDGKRYTKGFITIEEEGEHNTYYFKKNGMAQTGWRKIKGKKYYFYKSGRKKGVMARSTELVSSSGNRYVFDKNGVCIKKYKNKK